MALVVSPLSAAAYGELALTENHFSFQMAIHARNPSFGDSQNLFQDNFRVAGDLPRASSFRLRALLSRMIE
jgi:hypothetical protein